MAQGDRPLLGSIRDRARRRLASLVIGAMGVIVIGVVIVTVLFLTGEFDPADPQPAPTDLPIATPTVAPATPTAIATPVDDEPEYPSGSLPGMLALAPDRIDDDDTGLPIEATWADLATWFALIGVDPATAEAAELEAAMAPLELPGVLRTRGLSDDWRNIYGFSVRDVQQVITIGHAPDQIVIMRGDFEPDNLYDTWVRNGYFAVEVEETTIWSLFPGDRIDLSAPASRPALGLLNNIMVIGDDMIVASARQSGMVDFLRVANGDAAPLLAHDDLEQAVALWEPSGFPVTAILADGTILEVPASGTDDEPDASEGTAVATPLANAPLPEVEMVLFGVVPGEDDPTATRMRAVMLYDGEPDDLASVPPVVKARAEKQADWADRYRLESVELVGADRDMIEVVISRTGSPAPWSRMIEDRDLEPLNWSAEE